MSHRQAPAQKSKPAKRERKFWALAILSALLVVVTWRHGHTGGDQADAQPSATAESIEASPKVDCAAKNPFDDAEFAAWQTKHHPGRHNATAVDLQTDCIYSIGDETAQFQTASTGKVLVAVGVLEKVAAGTLDYATIQVDLKAMITQSDNNAADRLFDAMGGQVTLADLVKQFDMTSTSTDKRWGTTVTTSKDQAKLLDAVLGTDDNQLPEAQRTILRDLMKNVNPEHAWGAGSNIPAGYSVAVKNGWYQTVAGDTPPIGLWRINTLGYVWDDQGKPRWILTAYSNEWPSQFAGIEAWNELSSLVAKSLTS